MAMMSIVIGCEQLELQSAPQRPMILHAVLVPVGFELQRVYCGPAYCEVLPDVNVVDKTARRIRPESATGPESVTETRALYTRYRLMRPCPVWPGQQVRVMVNMPVLWGEGIEVEK